MSIEDELDRAAAGVPGGVSRAVITTANGLREMIERSRGIEVPEADALSSMLDDSRIHVVALTIAKEEGERIQAWVLTAIVGRNVPRGLWIDVPLDVFDLYTRTVSVPAHAGNVVVDA